MVGDSHAMGVTAEILQHELWATEEWLQLDDPVLSVQGSQAGGKDLRLSETREISLEAELAVTEGLLVGAYKHSFVRCKRLPQRVPDRQLRGRAGSPTRPWSINL